MNQIFWFRFQQLEMERLALAKEKEYLKKQQEDIQKGLSNLGENNLCFYDNCFCSKM